MPTALMMGLSLVSGSSGSGPSVVVSPSITGTATTEQTLTAGNATWSRDPDSRTRQWWLAEALMVDDDPVTDDDGNIVFINKVNIEGETGGTFVIPIAYGDFPPASRFSGDTRHDYVIGFDETATFGSATKVAESAAVGVVYFTDLMAGVGSFDSSTGWGAINNGFSITGGQLVGVPNAAAGAANYPITLAANTYRTAYDIVTILSGGCQPRFTGGTQGTLLGSSTTTAETHHEDIATLGNATAGFQKNIAFDGAIDNWRLFRIA